MEKGRVLGGTVKPTKHSLRKIFRMVIHSKSEVHDRVYRLSKVTVNEDKSSGSRSYDGTRCRQWCLG